jgi:hypothetical protein
MPRFEPNRPIETREPEIVVEQLPLGRHVFRLIVVDRDGNQSPPDELVITVRRIQR